MRRDLGNRASPVNRAHMKRTFLRWLATEKSVKSTFSYHWRQTILRVLNLSATKVTFNIRSRKFDHVTSDNSEHFKFIKISNVLVSSVVTA